MSGSPGRPQPFAVASGPVTGDARAADGALRWPDRLHAALSRVTSSGRYVPVIDGLRCVSILGVLLYHVGIWPSAVHRTHGPAEWFVAHLASMGFFGVQLFFAISGLILCQPFAEAAAAGRRAPSVRSYYVRRVLRIEPPFLICVAALFAAQSLLRHGTGRATPVPLEHFLATATYTHGALFDDVSPIDPVTWSLEVEVQFYLLAPFLFLALFRMRAALRRMTIALLALASAAWIATRGEISHDDRATLAFQACFFLAGVLVADLETSAPDAPPRRPHAAWDVVPPAAAALLFLALLPGAVVERAPALGALAGAACIAAAYLGVLRGRLWRRVLELRWIAVAGGMCYTLYLWHFPLMRLVQARLPAAPTGSFLADYALHAAVLVPAALVSGAVLFVLVEKPFMYRDWPQRFRARFLRR